MPLLAPFLISALVGGFATSIIQGLIKAAISIGIGFLVYQGLDALMADIMGQIVTNFDATPITNILGLLKVDKCLNVLASAVTVKYSLRATVNGLKKFEIK